jgi:hypothetical protein
MNRSVIRHLAIAALIAYPASALGQDQAPDVKGKWIGKTHTILVGKGGHWPKGRGTWDNPALLEKDLAFDIRGQDGRRFWGVTTLSGGGEKTDEPFIGELTGKDYKSFVFADTDGFWNGQSTAATRSRSATCIPTASPPWSAARRSSERAEPRALACNAIVWRPRAGVRRQPLACPDGGRHTAWPCRIFASRCSCVR